MQDVVVFQKKGHEIIRNGYGTMSSLIGNDYTEVRNELCLNFSFIAESMFNIMLK